MAKNPNKRSKAAGWDAPMTAAMKFFLVGCLAELYLLVVRSYFVHGTAVQMIAWYDHYLRYFLAGGAVLLIAGAAIFFLSRAKKLQVKPVVSEMSLYALVLGAFVALASALALWNMATVSLLTTLVPVVMVMGILWNLYDRECALSLTILGTSLVALWICRQHLNHIYYGGTLKVLLVLYVVLLVALAVLAKLRKLGKLLPAKANVKPIYGTCALSALAAITPLVNSTAAYYATWALALVVFGLAVYYTVKQL